jgi:uncharacterized delta-60 repeat protein
MAVLQPKYGEPPHWINEVTSTRLAGVAIDSNDNIYVVGGSSDLILAKYGNDGTPMWSVALGSVNNDFGNGIAIDSSDNIIVCGTYRRTTNNRDALVAKYDSDGNLIWARTMLGTGDSDNFLAVAVDPSDNIIVAGTTNTSGGTGTNCFLVKYSTDGNLTWQRALGGSGTDSADAVAVDSSGNIYIGGASNSMGTNYGFFVAKYNSSGSYQWGSKTQFGECNSLLVDASDTIWAFGRENYDGVRTNYWIIRYNSSGTVLYKSRRGNASDLEVINSATIDRAGDLILVGTVDYLNGTDRVYITKFSPFSNIWSKDLYKTTISTFGYSVAVDSSDNIILAGDVTGTGLLAKVHPDGTGTVSGNTYVYTSANVLSSSVTDITYGTTAALLSVNMTSSTTALTSNVPVITSSNVTLTNTLISIT